MRARGFVIAACWAVTLGCGRYGFELLDPHADGGVDGETGDGGAQSASGVFIEVQLTSGASLGGIAGADAYCLAELTAGTWVGKSAAIASGQLAAGNVHAWLCTTVACRDLVPGELYVYASASNSTRGGATFVATSAGYLANDGRRFRDDDVFGSDDGFHEYFTGRQTNQTPQTTTCGDWTTTVGDTRVAVNDVSFYPEKLSKYLAPCSANSSLICIVDPLPKP